LQQSFTACMPLLMATSAFRLQKRRQSSPQWRHLHHLCIFKLHYTTNTTTTTSLRPFFRDHPGEPVPEENFWTSWCKGRLTQRQTHWPSGWMPLHPDWLTSAHLHLHHPPFLQAVYPSCRPTNSVKALKAT